jgi:hypothetical protein
VAALKTMKPTVYSTDHGRICADCERPATSCICRQKKEGVPGKGGIRVGRHCPCSPIGPVPTKPPPPLRRHSIGHRRHVRRKDVASNGEPPRCPRTRVNRSPLALAAVLAAELAITGSVGRAIRWGTPIGADRRSAATSLREPSPIIEWQAAAAMARVGRIEQMDERPGPRGPTYDGPSFLTDSRISRGVRPLFVKAVPTNGENFLENVSSTPSFSRTVPCPRAQKEQRNVYNERSDAPAGRNPSGLAGRSYGGGHSGWHGRAVTGRDGITRRSHESD